MNMRWTVGTKIGAGFGLALAILVAISGVCEIAGGIGLLIPPLRRAIQLHALRFEVTHAVQERQEGTVRKRIGNGSLEAVKVRMEEGQVQIHTAVEETALYADFVVLRGFMWHWHLRGHLRIERAHEVVRLALPL